MQFSCIGHSRSCGNLFPEAIKISVPIPSVSRYLLSDVLLNEFCRGTVYIMLFRLKDRKLSVGSLDELECGVLLNG